ncbi:MAG: enoyl-CoA hydratase/isomerase family protein [Deltaproteobacteria bacterium]|nr:enoyl-CoA hydratase/isomerase family protein [Deltaproteobacteria bacterium]
MPNRLCTITADPGGIADLAIAGGAATQRQLLEAVQRQIASLSANQAVKGVIVRGQGEGFCRCCGVDTHTNPYGAGELAAFGQQVMFSLEKIGKPCIAAISGECCGVGLELALSCDFIIASRRARFGFPDIAQGRLPFCGGTQRLARLVGKSKAKEMIFGGELLAAEEAYRIGLVNRLYDDNELLPRTRELLERICSRSPFAVRIGGEVINAGYDIDLQTACLLERDAFALIFASHDRREGMQAFLDKREPEFKGE